ncbi:TlpA family protein disulfide reductase [Echinicola marina]|uniref:TlpA family protein disulfide reductase n=1 Tax=Echinicola marina TaxID=2859768 RepID=UPI001CF6602A|nr:TlpA disulfide reductase family protein [Echinicola marina]UCS91776.1 TlpA family protein disulfide reductase [Echinicola marina]
MKKILIPSALLLLISVTSFSQQKSDLDEAQLNQGFPVEIDFIKDQINLKNVTQSILDTQIDSLQVKFGGFTQGVNDGYWIALLNNEKLLKFSTLSPSDIQTRNLIDTLTLEYDNSSKKISVFIKYEKGSDKVRYRWLDGNISSKVMIVRKNEKAVELGEKMPNFQVTSLNGNTISIDDFKGKYLVINWWVTSCGPCIGEMPGLNELFEKYQSDDRIEFLAIAWDSVDKVNKFLTRRAFNYYQSIGATEVATILGESFPKHIIVNPDGLVSFYKEGGNTKIHTVIEEHLSKELN